MKTLRLLPGILLPLLLCDPAHATPPAAATGNFVTHLLSQTVRTTADGNLVIDQVLKFEITGTFSGTADGNVTIVLDLSTGRGTLRGTVAFAGTAAGVPGSLSFGVEGTVTVPALALNFTIRSGTGDLANLRGQGSLQGILNVGGTYAGQIHFEP